jgi:hypothetical protein
MSTWPRFVIIVTALLAGACAAQPAPTVDEFFRPAPDRGADYPLDKVYPQGRIFAFGGYALPMARGKADGFTMAGPYGPSLEQAAEHNLKVTQTISSQGLLTKEEDSDYRRMAPPEVVRQGIRRQVEAVMDSPQIAWWYITPEELRYWRKDEIRYLEIAADTIRATDPEKRPVWMYDPGHRKAGGLTHTARHLDILGKGLYTNYSHHRHHRIWVRWSIEQEKQAVEAVGREVIPIAVPEMFRQPPDEELHLIPAWVRHDVYLALITGAKGVVVFSMRQRPGFPAHEAYYQAYAQAAKEICGEGGLGQVFLFGGWREGISLQIYDGPRRVELGDLRYPSVNFADIAYGSSRYLVAVNSAEQPVSVRVRGLPHEEVLAYDVFAKADPEKIAGGQFSLHLAPLEAKCLRFAQEG